MAFYAVRVGLTPGVYDTWDECKTMVHKYPGAIYKKFATLEEAENFAGVKRAAEKTAKRIPKKETVKSTKTTVVKKKTSATKPNPLECKNIAYVDGSYNPETKVYGYGGFICTPEKSYPLQGHGDDPELASMRNVAGEIMGARCAAETAIAAGLKELVICYDYAGIEQWATGNWSCHKKATAEYRDYFQSIKDKISICFIKVKGHSGVEGNELADQLAKAAVGIM